MDMNAAFQEVGSYRAAAAICGTTDKTVKRAVAKARAAEVVPSGAEEVVAHNYDDVGAIIAERVERTDGRITAKRLLPVVRAAGYAFPVTKTLDEFDVEASSVSPAGKDDTAVAAPGPPSTWPTLS